MMKRYSNLAIMLLAMFLLLSTNVKADLLGDSLVMCYSADEAVANQNTVPYNQNLTSNGAPGTRTGKVGATAYDAPNDDNANFRYVASGNAIPDGNTNLTICGWHLLDTTEAGANQFYLSIGNGTANNMLATYIGVSPGNNLKFSDGVTDQDSGVSTTTAKWYHTCIVYNSTGSSTQVYFNGTIRVTSAAAITRSNDVLMLGQYPAAASFGEFDGGIDEVKVFNKTLTAAEVLADYNGTYGRSCADTYANRTIPPSTVINVNLLSQSPANITNVNLIPNGGNQTYAFNTTNFIFGRVYLNLTVTTGSACVQYINGTCRLPNNTNQVINANLNVNGTGVANYTFHFTENNVYPSSENLNFTQIALGTYTRVLTQENDYVADTILNISNISGFNFYEVPVLSTGIVRVYYFNSTYDFGSNPTTNQNVHEFCVLTNATTYNHTHNQSGHQLCPYTINATGYLGTTKVSGGGFMIRGNPQGVNITVANITARPNVARVTTNGGNTWPSLTGTIASHLHQFTTNDQVCTQAFGNYTTTFDNSSRTCELLDLDIFPPEPPDVLTPVSTTYNQFINITWEQSIPYAISRYITQYNVTLRNSDMAYNSTLNVSNNASRSYYWDTYTMNLTVGATYYVGVEATDNSGAKAIAFSENFTIGSNGLINVTAKDGETGATITNFSVNAYNAAAGVNVTVNASSNVSSLPITRGYNYTLTIDAPGYAIANMTAPTTNVTSSYQFNLSPTNSIYVYVFSQDTGLSLAGTNVTVTLLKGTTFLNSTSSTGRFLFQGLDPGNWTVTVGASGYATSTYFLMVNNRSTQTLNAYIAQSVISVIFTVKDIVTGDTISGGTLTMQNQISGNWVTIDQANTDAFGQAGFSLLPLHDYQFIMEATNYSTKIGLVNTFITSYTILLNANNTQQFITYGDQFTYKTSPTQVSANMTTFSITTSSPQGAIQWFAVVVTYNGTTSTQNVTGSPSGGTASVDVNLSGITGAQTVTATYYVKSVGISTPLVIPESWLVYGGFARTNYTLVNFVEYYGSPSSPIDMTTRGIIVTIFAVLLAAGTGFVLGVGPAIGVAATVFLLAGVFGWLGVGITVITVGALVGLLMLGGRT